MNFLAVKNKTKQKNHTHTQNQKKKKLNKIEANKSYNNWATKLFAFINTMWNCININTFQEGWGNFVFIVLSCWENKQYVTRRRLSLGNKGQQPETERFKV